eukprot:706851-Pyramimonas_sp.AAC.1
MGHLKPGDQHTKSVALLLNVHKPSKRHFPGQGLRVLVGALEGWLPGNLPPREGGRPRSA